MSPLRPLAPLVLLALPLAAQGGERIDPLPADRVTLRDRFWAPRVAASRDGTLPHSLEHCAGRIRNLRRAAGELDGEFEGRYPFDDSDLFKVVEGLANHVALDPECELGDELDEIVRVIAAAQEDDGYLYTARQLRCQRLHDWFLDERWANLSRSHELYNAGHLIEAGVAHHAATGERTLLDVAIRTADRIDADFGEDALRTPTGHPELELALVRLHEVTAEPRYLALAAFFLDQRGRGSGRESFGEYAQDHRPVVDQRHAVGHAVRGAYLYAAMADVARARGDAALGEAVDAMWNDVVGTKLYVTGGIGARGAGEAFGEAYELPAASAYCETCAAIGMVLWSHRMFLRDGSAGAIDVLERALYNNVLSGVALDGRSFFYPNPLATLRGDARREWFACACCPSNLARVVPAVGRYVCAMRGNDEVFVNLYVEGRARLVPGDLELDVRTPYPWGGKIEIEVALARPRELTLHLRIPGWARERPVPSDLYTFVDERADPPRAWLDDQPIDVDLDSGWLTLEREWRGGESIRLELPMPIRRVAAHDAVPDHGHRVALERGPLVHCVEACDVEESDAWPAALILDPAALRAVSDDALLGGCTVVEGEARIARRALGDAGAEASERTAFRAIPYALRSHRGAVPMSVWLATEAAAATPMPAQTLARRSRASASHHEELTGALSDQLEVARSDDKSLPHFHWWPQKGGTEWVQYDFDAPAEVAACAVFWMADAPRGECAMPAAWRVLWKDGDAWKPVDVVASEPAARDCWTATRFAPVRTSALRLEVDLQEGLSAGIHEWRVLAAPR